MVSAAEIVDKASLQAWLDGQPLEAYVLIEYRAAMRVAPLVWARLGAGQDNVDLTPLRFQRLYLLTGTAVKFPTPFHMTAAERSNAIAFNLLRDATDLAPEAAANAAGCAASAYDTFAHCAAEPTTATAYAVDAADAAAVAADVAAEFWAAVRADTELIERDALPQGLWPGPNPLASEWIQTREKWQAAGWDFWIDWYEDALAGREPDWTLLERVALIDPAIWDAGAQAVNAEIDRIQAKRRLETEAAALKARFAQLHQEAATAAHRGHNQPPELLDPPGAILREIVIVSEALAEAEAELGKPAPEPGALRRIGEALLRSTWSILRYCGSKADIALTEAARVVGSTGTKALIAMIVAETEAVRAFVEALLRFIG